MDIGGLSQSQLLELVFKDELTGLYNRRFFNTFLEKLDPANPEPVTLCMIDVDLFKQINDKHGHAAGDETLKRIGEVIKSSCRNSDHPIRYAGDEFALLMPGCPAERGFEVAERLRKAIEDDAFEAASIPRDDRPTLSIGVATFPTDACDRRELFDHADRALYVSKRTRNRVTSFSNVEQDADLDLHKALANFPARELIGRTDHWIDAASSIDRVLDGDTLFCLIRGKVGIGKSRFLSEIQRFSAAAGMTMVQYKCSASDIATPYAVLSRILTKVLLQDTGLTLLLKNRLSASARTALADILPDRRILVTDKSESGRRNFGKPMSVELAMAIHDALEILASPAPLAILLDNLEFCDPGTLDVLLRYLRRGQQPILIYGAAQEMETETANPERRQLWLDFVSELSAEQRHAKIIRLRSLSFDDTKDLVTALLPGFKRSDEFDKTIHEMSEGNPLFIEIGLRSMIQDGHLERKNEQWQFTPGAFEKIPSDLEQLVLDQFRRLDKSTLNLLSTIAVAGQTLSLTEIRELAELRNEGEILDTIENARRANILVDSADPTEPGFQFVSGGVHKLCAQQMSADKKTRIHLTIAKIIERNGSKNLSLISGKVSYHLTRSNDPDKSEFFNQVLSQFCQRYYDRAVIDRFDCAEESPLQPGREPVSDEALRHLPGFLKSLTSTVRTLKLYAPGSRMRSEAKARLWQSYNTLFELAQQLTFSSRARNLTVNGKVLSALNPKAVQSLIQIFQANSIATLIMAQKMTRAELDLIVTELSIRKDHRELDRNYWRRFIRTKQVQHCAIIQQPTFQSRATMVAPKLKPTTKRSLKDADLAVLQKIAAAFANLLGQYRQKLEGSESAENTSRQLHNHITSFIRLHDGLFLGAFEQSVVVNSSLIPPQSLGAHGQELVRAIRLPFIQGIGFLEGVTALEIQIFCKRLAPYLLKSPQKHTAIQLTDLDHIVIGDDMLQAAERVCGYRPKSITINPQKRRTTVHDASIPITTGVARPQRMQKRQSPWPSDKAAQNARRLSNQPPTELLKKAADLEKLTKILSTLFLNQQFDLCRRVLEPIAKVLLTGNLNDRLRATKYLKTVHKHCPDQFKRVLVKIVSLRIADVIERESESESLSALCDLGQQLIFRAVEDKEWAIAARIVWAIGKRREDSQSQDIDIAKITRKAIDSVLVDIRVRLVREALTRGNGAISHAAAHFIEGCGKQALQFLVQCLSEHDLSVENELRIINLLLLYQPLAAEALKAELTPFISAEKYRRLLRAIPRLLEAPESPLKKAIGHDDPFVRLTAVQVTAELPNQQAIPILIHGLQDPNASVVALIIPALANKPQTEALHAIAETLKQSVDDEIKKQCLLALGKRRASQFWPIIRKYITSDENTDLKLAAVWCAAQFPTPHEFDKLVPELLQSSDAEISQILRQRSLEQ